MIHLHPIQVRIIELAKRHNLSALGLRKIGRLIEVAHPQQVRHHILQLQKKGLLDGSYQPRVGKRTSRNAELASVPIYGAANCGPAMIFAEQRPEGYLRVSKRIIGGKRDVFAIRAVGYSMNQANVNGNSIEDGDYVLVQGKDTNIKNGDYVLSVIDDSANIKRVKIDNTHQRLVLQSESERQIPPILVDLRDKYIINGKVFDVIKK